MFQFVRQLLNMWGKPPVFDSMLLSNTSVSNLSCDETTAHSFGDNLTAREKLSAVIGSTRNRSAKGLVRQMIAAVNETVVKDLINATHEKTSSFISLVDFVGQHWLLITSSVIAIFLIKKIYDLSQKLMVFDIPLECMYEYHDDYQIFANKSGDEDMRSIENQCSEESQPMTSSNIFGGEPHLQWIVEDKDVSGNEKENRFKEMINNSSTDLQNKTTDRQYSPNVYKALEVMLTHRTSASQLKKIFDYYYRDSDELQMSSVLKNKPKSPQISMSSDESLTNSSESTLDSKVCRQSRFGRTERQTNFAANVYYFGFIAMTAFIVYKTIQ